MSPWVVAFFGAILAALAFGLAVLRLAARSRQYLRRVETLEKSLEELETTFGKFVPPELVGRMAGEGTELPAQNKKVTVLFADIRGFTALTERLPPEILVDILNGYIRRMSGAITRNHGVVNKLIGDGIMASFGTVRPNAWQSTDAVAASVDMIRELTIYNRELASNSRPELAIGIGIHTGEAIVGIVGSEHLLEYTALGDVVNVASRVETLTRALCADILITDAVERELDDRFELDKMEPAPVKGKSGVIQTYSVRAE